MRKEKGGPWIRMCAIVLYPTVKLLARRVSTGPKLPRHGGVLLVMNHVSHLDPVFDAVLVHNNERVPRFLAKSSLWKIPVLGKIMAGAGQVPVFRGTADAKESLRAANEGLEQGKLLVIYPEGTITKDPDGWPMASRTGVARLALANDVPVIPAARWGTRAILDKYNKKFRPFPRKTVTTIFGEPIDLSAYRDQPVTTQVLREVTDLLMERVKELLEQARGEQAPAGFYSPARAKQNGE
ncbi:lysophospholipid acyltransferase family protein [Kutzneria kofuensis]|uniref:1-acyl-sn-glycerol-3-phosphate acyltransferase n=1 Tax=Kutzneria kofuensis TaxID=103725 RepID=A0A7W9NIN0_9PSEU|nr:lysophospholipid acyltransferase family protein [Kutzneria kofuensis]MBB5894035.1 1-acyl-sn-glycerol-3-phosphate acyltransferase [Kutzneria kofuensis]